MSRPRRIATIIALLAATGSVFLASASINRAEAVRPSTSLACGSLSKLMLAQLGISPDALTAIGATDDQVRSIVTEARALCDVQAGGFDGAQAAVEQAQARYNDLSERVRRGLANEADRTQLAQTRVTLTNAVAERDVVLSQLQAGVDGVLDAAQRQRLTNIVAARDVEVPVQYKLTQRSDEAWITLRDQLSEERRLGREPGSSPITRLTGDELAASDLLANRRAGVAAIWQQTLSDR